LNRASYSDLHTRHATTLGLRRDERQDAYARLGGNAIAKHERARSRIENELRWVPVHLRANKCVVTTQLEWYYDRTFER
jgi:hypothetical protein